MNDKIFVITGPSGAGEDSVIKGLSKKIEIDKAITTTTRKMRPFESEGDPYYFISKERFQEGIENKEFFEYAEEDMNNFYGITHQEIQRLKSSDKVKIWKIDYKGALASKDKLDNAIIIYISTPRDQLEGRLIRRAGSTDEFVKSRMEYMKGWEENKDKWDHEIANKDGELDLSIAKALDIVNKYTDNIDN